MLLTLVPDPLRRSVGGTHTDRRKAGFQPALRPVSPAHISPLGIGQHVFGCHREMIGNMPLTRPAPNFNRPDELHIHWINLEMARNANRPSKTARREPLAERRAQPITSI